MNDDEIGRDLIKQVATAMPRNGTEQNVVTHVSRPMWRAWCRFVQMPEDSRPTAWFGIGTHRIYGSETIIVESNEFFAVSRSTHLHHS